MEASSANTVAKSLACNAMSCDRNCFSQRWAHWTPCSVAGQGAGRPLDRVRAYYGDPSKCRYLATDQPWLASAGGGPEGSMSHDECVPSPAVHSSTAELTNN